MGLWLAASQAQLDTVAQAAVLVSTLARLLNYDKCRVVNYCFGVAVGFVRVSCLCLINRCTFSVFSDDIQGFLLSRLLTGSWPTRLAPASGRGWGGAIASPFQRLETTWNISVLGKILDLPG